MRQAAPAAAEKYRRLRSDLLPLLANLLCRFPVVILKVLKYIDKIIFYCID